MYPRSFPKSLSLSRTAISVARNIVVHDGHISAVIDMEFAGSCPMSELLGGVGVEWFEMEDEILWSIDHGATESKTQ